MRKQLHTPPLAGVAPLFVQLHVAFLLVSFAQAQSSAASPAPSPAPIATWSGSISTGYLGGRGGEDGDQTGEHGENGSEPPPPGPPPVLVIQPDRAISCASVADEQLQEELARKFSLASRESSRFVEIMLDQDENGDLQIKQAATPDEAVHAPAAEGNWFSRVFRACFRRPAAGTEAADDLEMGVVSRGASSTRNSISRSRAASVTRGGRRRSTLQQGVVEEEVPGPLEVQWSGPSVSELRRETEPSEAVLAAARSVGVSQASSVATSTSSTAVDDGVRPSQ